MNALRTSLRGAAAALLVAAVSLALLGSPAAGQAPADRPAPPFTLQGSGEGHGAGLSQWGARALARAGRTHVEILQHFYAGVTVAPHPAAQSAEPLRVGLFHDHPVADRTVLELAALRADDGGAVDVRMTPDGTPTRIPAGQTWTIRHDPGVPILRPPGLALRDAAGSAVARGAGPVTVTFATPQAPALRLPQVTRSDDPAAGTLRHGTITLTRDAESGHFRPVLQLPLEEYLLGVDQMPATWGASALEAQAVVARTHAARRLAAGPVAVCDCHLGVAEQHYRGFAQEGDPERQAWVAAVAGTVGQAVSVGDALVDPVFAPAHGGRSENAEQSWAFAGQAVPHLRSAGDPWVNDPELAATYPGAAWDHELDHRVLADLVGLAVVTVVEVAARTVGGTPEVLSVSGWDTAGARVANRQYAGGTIPVAGAELFLAAQAHGAPPPSQQIGVIGFSRFRDVPARSLHAYNVASIAERGVTTGRPDGTYDPRAGVRRDQMATFIARALDLPLHAGGPDRFDDVPAGSAHRQAINAVAAAGIAQGVGPRRYAPGATVTRDQMATFIARAFDLGEVTGDRFSDTAASVHRTRINAVATQGITAGCTADRYCPRLPVTRDQMASFLARALGFGW